MLLEGLHIPLTTPFRRDGALNSDALAANVARYSLTPAAGLIVLGPAGEPTLLNDDETREALRVCAQAAAPEKVLIAGIARDSVAGVLELATFAAEQRYDAVLVGAPSILASRNHYRELLVFFQTVADRSPLPVVLVARAFLSDVFDTILTHPNIAGCLPDAGGKTLHLHHVAVSRLVERTTSIKRDVTVTHIFTAVTGRMQRASASSLIAAASLTATAVAAPQPAAPTLRTRTKSVGFQIIAAHAPVLLDALNAGAVGIAPAFAAAAPQACYEIYAAWKDQDAALASEKQQRIVEAARMINSLGPGGLKFAADLNGYAGGLPRLPHLPADGAQRAQLEQLMKPLHN